MGAYKNFHRKGVPFTQTINTKPVIPPPESSHWFWNPNRVGITFGPEWFMKMVREIDPDLNITWDRYQEKWLVWMKSPRLQSKLCSGWMLLFPVRESDNSYCPLDERIFARLYSASAQKWGRAKDYFLAVEREQERDREKGVQASRDDTGDKARDYYDFMKIKVSGCGPSNGSKFANHFSG